MKTFQRLFTNTLVVVTFLLGFATSAAKAGDAISQAQPVITLLKAVKKGDQQQLKSAFSENMQAQYEKEGWDKVLQRYQDGFKTAFGDYKPDDFTFEYEGDNEKGRVSVIQKGKRFPSLRVIKGKSEWKLNER